jgi:release factor glutamine methyltransferase
MKNVLEVVQATSDYFTRNGIESPRLNIELLLAHVLGMPRMELYLQFDRPLGEKELAPLRELVRKRAQGEPLQHLLGTVEFLDHTFLCDPRALIPRPETEQLCELLLARYAAPGSAPERVADIGTGSGVIAITLALAWRGATVHAVDVSPDALALARDNAHRLGALDQLRFLHGNLAEPLDATDAPFDLVVANLPYIPTGEIAALSREVQRDPMLALDGGTDGCALMRRLIASAPRILKPGGLLALEHGLDQAALLAEMATVTGGYKSSEIVKDYSGRERYLFLLTHG